MTLWFPTPPHIPIVLPAHLAEPRGAHGGDGLLWSRSRSLGTLSQDGTAVGQREIRVAVPRLCQGVPAVRGCCSLTVLACAGCFTVGSEWVLRQPEVSGRAVWSQLALEGCSSQQDLLWEGTCGLKGGNVGEKSVKIEFGNGELSCARVLQRGLHPHWMLPAPHPRQGCIPSAPRLWDPIQWV